LTIGFSIREPIIHTILNEADRLLESIMQAMRQRDPTGDPVYKIEGRITGLVPIRTPILAIPPVPPSLSTIPATAGTVDASEAPEISSSII
jgi:hypothetical protein